MLATLPEAKGGWGMLPDLFWSLHPRDFWWMFQARVPEKKYGNLTASDVAEISKEMKEAANDGPRRRRG